MSSQWERRISRGGIVALITLTSLGLLLGLVVIVDGRIAAWSQHLAQNAADASALAGTRSLLEIMRSDAFTCNEASDRLILQQIQLYADLNQGPEAAPGLNVQGYYLGHSAAGYHAVLNPTTGQRWQVGATGTIPCEAIEGVMVELYYPQETLLTRLLTIEHARVVVEAAATSQGVVRLEQRALASGSSPAVDGAARTPSSDRNAVEVASGLNQATGFTLTSHGKIKMHLTRNAGAEALLLGKQRPVSQAAPVIRHQSACYQAGGTRVGLLNGTEHGIQSVATSLEFGSEQYA